MDLLNLSCVSVLVYAEICLIMKKKLPGENVAFKNTWLWGMYLCFLDCVKNLNFIEH